MIFHKHFNPAALTAPPPNSGRKHFRSGCIAWLPLIILTTGSMFLINLLPPWMFMWVICFALFFGCKWLTWWQARRPGVPAWRNIAYLFVWPGMDAREFLDAGRRPVRPSTLSWLTAFVKTLFGVGILWGLTPVVPASHLLLKGWVGMTGVILILHFGTFDLLAFAWQAAGIQATPLMNYPTRAKSLGEFWGHRWNSAFNRLAHELLFRPVHRRLGIAAAMMLVFLISGLVHDLILSVPARAGYGLPTAYFLIQGTGLLFERSRFGRKLGLGTGGRGWLFTLAITTIPAFWLFHPAFVRNVILPMLHAIGAT